MFVMIVPADGRENLGHPLYGIEEDPYDEFVGHHLLDEGVLYQPRTNQFAWDEGLDGYLLVDGHEDEILYFGFGVDNYDGQTLLSGEYKELVLAFFNELLARMNWIESGK